MAAGGGGASSNASSQSSDFNAQGLVNPRKDFRNSIKVNDLTEDAGNFICQSLLYKMSFSKKFLVIINSLLTNYCIS